MKHFLYAPGLLALSACWAAASFNNTRDIYCMPQPVGTCTLTLHLGAFQDKLQAYWNHLSTQSTVAASPESASKIKGNGTGLKGNQSGHGKPPMQGSKVDVELDYGSLTEYLTLVIGQESPQKRSARRPLHKRDNPTQPVFNASNFLGDIALIHNHNCNPLSKYPATNLTDNTVVTSSLNQTVNFKLYQPGSETGHPDFNIVFKVGVQRYQDIIAIPEGVQAKPGYPCQCLAANATCPDRSMMCCSCTFACKG